MNNYGITRRDFIKKAGATALAAVIVSPVIGIEADASSRKPALPMQPIVIDTANPDYSALAKTNGALKIPNPHDNKKPIIVCRISEKSVAAYSSKCTHFGCEVGLPENNVVACPCHGSKFDATGKVVHGPARKNLSAFSAVLEGNIITIKDMQS